MFCFNCGKQLPEEARFCSYCGTNLNTVKASINDTTNTSNSRTKVELSPAEAFILALKKEAAGEQDEAIELYIEAASWGHEASREKVEKLLFVRERYTPAEAYEAYILGLRKESAGEYDKAKELQFKAAHSGYREAQMRIGAAYEYGELGLKKDKFEAAKYYKMAEDGGCSRAKQKL